jgi:hypothetical protein
MSNASDNVNDEKEETILKTMSKLRVNVRRVKKVQFILDYDDTIIPSSMYLYNYERERKTLNEFKKCMSEHVNLEVFDECLHKLLSILKTIGDVKIVTLSEKGWIEMSCTVLFSKSSAIISSIPVIYALEFAIPRDKTAENLTNSKYKAMLSCIDKDTDLLVSIGDSNIEKYSSLKLKENNIVPRVLVIKTIEHPTVNTLLDTLIHIGYWINHMVYVVSHRKSVEYQICQTSK